MDPQTARQLQFRFDKVTLKKIAKGAIIASTGAAALAFLNYIGTIHFDDPFLASFVAWVVPFAVNAVREWMKGI